MGRERQKAKNRSSISKTKPKLNGRTKAGKTKVNFLGDEVIANNWNRNLTVAQNYERLGLSVKLNDAAGGKENIGKVGKGRDGESTVKRKRDSLSLAGIGGAAQKFDEIEPQTVQVERDPETGRILRVIQPAGEADAHEQRRKANPLNDPLNDLDVAAPLPTTNPIPRPGVVAQLEAEAAEEAERLARTRKPRRQSEREQEWIAKLVEKHGDNVMAMVRDRRLNPMQQTEGDVRRRLAVFERGGRRGRLEVGGG